jgi:acyl-coenzyme A synthetase/AMP-(fatty) acid ligase
MSTLTLFTSGSTDEPKIVTHSWDYIRSCAIKSRTEIGLTKTDIVLDVFPANTIAHYTITAFPAVLSGAQHVSSNFSAYTYPDLITRFKPTVIALIPRHLELLSNTKAFKQLDMSSVRYMVTGSSKIEQSFIDAFRERGVQTVANWYGMTEAPPPVMIGYNTTNFTKITEDVSFSSEGECIINGWHTGDIFDVSTMTFSHRKNPSNGKTWKTKV